MSWRPGRGQRQAKSTLPGIAIPALDLFCQIQVRSKLSRPSMNTRTWPASQQRSPSVPIRAIPSPSKRMTAGAAVMLSATKRAPSHPAGVGAAPCGASEAAAIDDRAECAEAKIPSPTLHQ
jgi:hypothetical protein